ncbi:unnamed protein product [Chrysoparadoxa australica]
MTLVIIWAGALVGFSTEPKFESSVAMAVMDAIVLVIFTLDVILKIVAEGRQPGRYFHDAWNRFDFFIVFFSILPLLIGLEIGSIVSMLRLLRLLRVLKLVKSLPRLRVIVEALISGVSSIAFITLMLVLFFFVFSIVGMILFELNDPWHFGRLNISMLTLFRAATIDDWTDLMYINMYGCDIYGYDEREELCTHPIRWGWLSCFFFLIVVTLGAMVLLSLFIGVVTTSMEEATNRQKDQEAVQKAVMEVAQDWSMSETALERVLQVFAMLDRDNNGTLDINEIEPMLLAVSERITHDYIHMVYHKVVQEHASGLTVSDFVMLCCHVKEWLETTTEPYVPPTQEGETPVEAGRRPSKRPSVSCLASQDSMAPDVATEEPVVERDEHGKLIDAELTVSELLQTIQQLQGKLAAAREELPKANRKTPARFRLGDLAQMKAVTGFMAPPAAGSGPRRRSLLGGGHAGLPTLGDAAQEEGLEPQPNIRVTTDKGGASTALMGPLAALQSKYKGIIPLESDPELTASEAGEEERASVRDEIDDIPTMNLL